MRIHEGPALVFNPNYHINGWETNPRFPMPKYQFCINYWLKKGFVIPKNFIRHHLLLKNALERVHLPSYLDDFFQASWTPK
ncbi:MAG: hypothetical protein Ct9H90mP9_4840 [Pseudomonadota bacterium]|nr:MAG: hypothetical protein Ct9H90mP9_4840 [Pseudomonadota bacterium]